MPQNLVLDAKLNKDSYNVNNTTGGVSNLDGWVRFSVTRYERPAGSNFAAQLYQGPDGNYKISYRGSADLLGAGDKAMNAAIVAGQWAAEMSESVKFTFEAIKQVAADKGISFAAARDLFTFTGHSQGGFEAELNAKFFGVGGTSIDGPGASLQIGVAEWNAMKDWARAQEPAVQQTYDLGDFMARRYTLLVGGVNQHVKDGGMVVDNATASLFLQYSSMFTTPLGAVASLGVQGLYLHSIDNIIALEELRQQQPWLQKIVNANDPLGNATQMAWDISEKWAQVQVGGPGAPVNADDVQAIIADFLVGREGQTVAVQQLDKSVRIVASNGDELTLMSDASGVKIEGQGNAVVQTEYVKGGVVAAVSTLQVNGDNVLISRSGPGFDGTYELDGAGQIVQATYKAYNAAKELQSESIFVRNPNGSTIASRDVTIYAEDGVTIKGRAFDSISADAIGQMTSSLNVAYAADGTSILKTKLTERQADNSLLATARDGAGSTLYTAQVEVLDDGTSSTTTIDYVTGTRTIEARDRQQQLTASETFDANGQLLSSGIPTTQLTSQQIITVLNDIAGLVGAIQGGKPLPILSSGLHLLNTFDNLDGNVSNNMPYLTQTTAVVGGLASLYSLSNALENGDGLTKVSATLNTLNYVNSTLPNLLGQTTPYSAPLNSFLNGSTVNIGGQQVGGLINGAAPGVLPVLGLVMSIRSGDPVGIATGLIGLINPALLATSPVGWIIAGVQILSALMNEPPESWGSAKLVFDANGQISLDAVGEGSGPDRVRQQLQGTLNVLNNMVAQAQAGSPSNPLGIVPQRMPTITWREARQDDKGYAITDIDPVTGEQRYPYLRWDDASVPFSSQPSLWQPDPSDPYIRASFNQHLAESALAREAIAAQWEVDTARIQQDVGDPNAGLSEAERAARMGLGATYDPVTKKPVGQFRAVALDLDGDGQISTAAKEAAGNDVAFDWDDSGYLKQVAWVQPNDAYLFLDRNLNGVVDSGKELFSNPLVTDAAKGLRSLATWDTNGDGKITAADPVFSQLKVWQDYNQDANNTSTFSVNSASGVQSYQVQDESNGVKELRSLAELGITAIDYGNGSYEMSSASGNSAVGYSSISSISLEAEQDGVRYTPVGAGIRIETTDGTPLIVITQVQSEAAVLGGFALTTAGETIGTAQAPLYEDGEIGAYNPDTQGGAHTLMITRDTLLANDTWLALTGAAAGLRIAELGVVNGVNTRHELVFVRSSKADCIKSQAIPELIASYATATSARGRFFSKSQRAANDQAWQVTA